MPSCSPTRARNICLTIPVSRGYLGSAEAAKPSLWRVWDYVAAWLILPLVFASHLCNNLHIVWISLHALRDP